MGSRDGYPDERPRHRVRISRGFWLGRTPVTRRHYRCFDPTHEIPKTNDLPDDPDYPITEVSWRDAIEFCRWVTQTALNGAPEWSGFKACLPTEAQWEFACRGSLTDDLIEVDYWNGDGREKLFEIAWIDHDPGEALRPVAFTTVVNSWGLHDMHGLVWEWCEDIYDPVAYVTRGAMTVDPVVSFYPRRDHFRSLRGGSWIDSAKRCRLSARDTHGEYYGNWCSGFRVAVVSSGTGDIGIES